MIILALPPRGPGLRAEDILNIWMFILVTTPIALIVDRLERTNEALEHALAERRRSEAEVRSIVEGVVEALLLVAPSQRVIRVNHQFEDLFGLSASSLPGKTLDEFRPVLARSFRDPDDVTRLDRGDRRRSAPSTSARCSNRSGPSSVSSTWSRRRSRATGVFSVDCTASAT